MARTKLADRKLPDYTRGEEIANMVTHIVGGAFGIVALAICVVFSALRHDPYRVVSSAIYGVSLVFLYTMSSVYHGLTATRAKKVMQVLDHCTIYFLICGTYTPIVLGPIRELSPVLGWVIFGIVWSISAMAVVFTAIDHHKYRILSMICYIGIGWVIVFALKPTVKAVTVTGFWYLLAGGIAYTVGAVLFGIAAKKNVRYLHAVFHLFVLAGTALQFVTVFNYCILK